MPKASATIGGTSHSINFSTSGSGPQKELTLIFGSGDRRASAQ